MPSRAIGLNLDAVGDYPASIDGEYGALTSAIWGRGDAHAGVYEMVPAAPAGRFHACSRCGLDIEPDEPYFRSRDGTVASCDSCNFEEEADL